MKKEEQIKKGDVKMTHKERKALQFYKMTRCNWGGDTLHDEVSDEEYLKHIRDIRKEKDRQKDK